MAEDGIECLDVPAKLAHRVRMLSTGHGRKNDGADALSVGIAALNSTGLRSVHTDETAQVLRTLTEYRDDLIRIRTQTANPRRRPRPGRKPLEGQPQQATGVCRATPTAASKITAADHELGFDSTSRYLSTHRDLTQRGAVSEIDPVGIRGQLIGYGGDW
ncbi:transposase [Nocardia sp. NPDC059691]|uniref:IS110 family transposase n=1 Tax=Nocardia sp. NPDC059691 TaxID=3346908 RepID=UPI003693F170